MILCIKLLTVNQNCNEQFYGLFLYFKKPGVNPQVYQQGGGPQMSQQQVNII